jgi:hypothetical protein
MKEVQMNGVRERREIHTEFWWESQKERPLGRCQRRWRIVVQMDLKERGFDGADWIHLAV